MTDTAVDWEKILTLAGLPVAGAIASHLWSRFRGRMVRLYWSAEHTPMAFATEDFGFGKIDILYNGQPSQNIHVTRVVLQNASTRDLASLVVDVGFFEGTTILRSVGFIPGSLSGLPHTPSFAAALQQGAAGSLPQLAIEQLLKKHQYEIPVLNRGGTAVFALLVHRNDHNTPNVTLGCDHVGTRVLYRVPVPQHYGVSQAQAVYVGAILGLLLIAGGLLLKVPLWTLGFGGWLLGIYVIPVGAALVRFWRAALQLLS